MTSFYFGVNVGSGLNQANQVTSGTSLQSVDVQIVVNESTFQNKKEVKKAIIILLNYLNAGPNLGGQTPIQP